jgi:uncharacterized protein (DUF885 family)
MRKVWRTAGWVGLILAVALGYAVYRTVWGELKILELREKARAALGAKFDIKDLHAVILENGGVPLTVLEQLVDEWIARTRGSASRGFAP